MLVKVASLGGSAGTGLGAVTTTAASAELCGRWWVVRGTGEEAAEISDSTAGSRSLSVIVVEDHVLVREGTAELLSRQGGLRVVGQTGSAEEALELLSDLRPDVALVDVELPGMSGIALAHEASDLVFTLASLSSARTTTMPT